MYYVKKNCAYIGFAIVVIGIIILNCTKPPWQFLGLVIFVLAILWPVVEALGDVIVSKFPRVRYIPVLRQLFRVITSSKAPAYQFKR